MFRFACNGWLGMSEKEFKREPRYVVLKIKDVLAHLSACEIDRLQEFGEKCADGRNSEGKPPLNAVVVEQDWPEFDLVWQMIEARMTGQQYALLLPPIADRFSELERQRDALLAGVETATRILREIAEASDCDYEDVEELEALIARVKLMPNGANNRRE